jgi:hypothetical protein
MALINSERFQACIIFLKVLEWDGEVHGLDPCPKELRSDPFLRQDGLTCPSYIFGNPGNFTIFEGFLFILKGNRKSRVYRGENEKRGGNPPLFTLDQ